VELINGGRGTTVIAWARPDYAQSLRKESQHGSTVPIQLTVN
jgi:hypothetical protein